MLCDICYVLFSFGRLSDEFLSFLCLTEQLPRRCQLAFMCGFMIYCELSAVSVSVPPQQVFLGCSAVADRETTLQRDRCTSKRNPSLALKILLWSQFEGRF